MTLSYVFDDGIPPVNFKNFFKKYLPNGDTYAKIHLVAEIQRNESHRAIAKR